MRRIAWLVAVLLVLASFAAAQELPRITPVPTARPQLKSQEMQAPSPEALRQSITAVTAPVSREMVINSLLASEKGQALLEDAVRGSGMAPEQLAMRSLSGNTIDPEDVSREAVTGFTPPPEEPQRYGDFDWESGVTLKPLGVACFEENGTRYPAASFGIFGVTFGRPPNTQIYGLPTVAEAIKAGVLPLWSGLRTYYEDVHSVGIGCVFDLPDGDALFVVTFHLAPVVDGGWAGLPYQDQDRLDVWIGTQPGSQSPVTPNLVLLPDGNGLVLTTQVDCYPHPIRSAVGMRSPDLWVELWNAHVTPLLFSGVTIMRL